jgi:hypothetical protein
MESEEPKLPAVRSIAWLGGKRGMGNEYEILVGIRQEHTPHLVLLKEEPRTMLFTPPSAALLGLVLGPLVPINDQSDRCWKPCVLYAIANMDLFACSVSLVDHAT